MEGEIEEIKRLRRRVAVREWEPCQEEEQHLYSLYNGGILQVSIRDLLAGKA